MLEIEQEKELEETSGNRIINDKYSNSWFVKLPKKLSALTKESRLYDRSTFFLIILLIASLAWFLSDSTEPESAARIAPLLAQAPETVRHEETIGMKEAQGDVKVSDPFCLLHKEEQAALAAIVAVGGTDSEVRAKAKRPTVKLQQKSGVDSTRAEEGQKTKTAEQAVAVLPKVHGTVANSNGTVVLFSFGEQNFFLMEGEERDGVLLQSLSEKSAVVVVDGKSYTLSLPS